MRSLDLVVPGLCGPLPDLEGLQENPTTASLARLLTRADRSSNTASGFHPELASLFGMDETDNIPSAALSMTGYGQQEQEGSWMHADPVHLQADMDHAILRDSQSLDISADDASALVEEINAHFSSDNIRLLAVDNNHWFIDAGEYYDVVTTPLHDVIGRNVNFFLPRGRHEKFLKSFMNEVQMLVHASRVNQNREQSGLLPINSLWLWGGGKLPAPAKTTIQKVFSNHVLVKGLAEVHGVSQEPLHGPGTLLEAVNDGTHCLAVNDELFNIACYGDVCAWQEKLETVFINWLEPLVTGAMKNKTTLKLYPCNGVRYVISPANKYRLWRNGNLKDHILLHE